MSIIPQVQGTGRAAPAVLHMSHALDTPRITNSALKNTDA